MIHSTTLEHGGLQMDDYEIEHIDEKDRYVGINSMEYVNSICLLYTSPSPRDLSTSRMPSSA